MVACALVVPGWAEARLPDPTPWVPASANLVVYFDWSTFSESPLFYGLESSLIENGSLAGVENFRELTGMDPLRDVWAVVFFTTSEADAGAQSGIACYGAFDPERIIETLEMRRQVHRSEYRETLLLGVSGTDLHPGGSGREQVVAFPNSTTALYGAPAQVRRMLDAGFGFAPSASSEEAELAEALAQLTTADALWAVGTGDENLASQIGVAGLDEVSEIASFSLAARVGSLVQVRARAETLDAEAASALANLVRGIAAMSTLQGHSDASLQALLESLEVETVDEVIDISFELEADAVRDHLDHLRLERSRPPDGASSGPSR